MQTRSGSSINDGMGQVKLKARSLFSLSLFSYSFDRPNVSALCLFFFFCAFLSLAGSPSFVFCVRCVCLVVLRCVCLLFIVDAAYMASPVVASSFYLKFFLSRAKSKLPVRIAGFLPENHAMLDPLLSSTRLLSVRFCSVRLPRALVDMPLSKQNAPMAL